MVRRVAFFSTIQLFLLIKCIGKLCIADREIKKSLFIKKQSFEYSREKVGTFLDLYPDKYYHA